VFVRRLKLRPPQLLPLWMKRARLEQRLAPETRVVSIIAGPGYGKTVLAARLYSAWAGQKFWYSLDAADADLAVLVSHMDAGLRALEVPLPEFDPSNAAALGSPKEIGSRFAEGLAEARNPVLLVFDDVHVLEKSRSLAALDELVRRAGQGNVAFVLSGRSMPVALGTIATAGQLESIAASDLAFNDSEILAYLRLAVQEKVSDALVRLAAQAEGWAAGLTLIASSARKVVASGVARSETLAPDEASLPPANSDEMRHYLFDYLASEVLTELTAAERQFLLDTSILEQLEVELCDALASTTGSRKILASFTDRGLFVARRSDDAYTYHQLFREFLRHNLERAEPAEHIASLHRRAAQVFAARGDARQAITHYLEAGDIEAAISSLEAAALDMLRMGLISSVDAVLRRIHPDRVRTSPILMTVLGRVQRERGEWDNALQTLELAIAGARNRQQFDVLAEAVRTCAPILGSRGEFSRLRDMLDEALASSVELPESSLSSLRMTLAAVHVEADELDEALTIYRDITPLIVARGDLAAHGLVLHNTGVAHLRRGDIYTGLSLYERALKLKEHAGQHVSKLTTLGDLIYVKTLLGDLDEAERLVDVLLSQAEDIGATHIVTRALEQRGALKLLRGDIDAAQELLRRAQASADPADMILMPEIEHGLAKCALFRRNFAEADALCAHASANLSSLGRHQQLAPILITRAHVLAASGDTSMSIKLAEEAIVECGQGANAIVQATTALEAAAILAAHASVRGARDAERVDRHAAEAATTAIGLVHQRDYRFLLHTKADVFERLRPHLHRWGIGSALMPEQRVELPSSLRIEALGALRVFVEGKEVSSEAWKRRRALDVFAYLFSQRGRAVARARLIDLWWPESDADAAHDSLRVAISAIRKVVGDVIKYEANAYRFVAPPNTVIDVALFDEFLDHARQAAASGDAERARHKYKAAADLYRGDFLEGMQEGGWQWHQRERLRAACIEALRWIAQDRQEARDATGLRLAVERILEIAPFDLEAVRMRLEALAGDLRFAEAEQDYAAWRERYRAAVGAEAPDFWKSPKPIPDASPRTPVPAAG